MGDVDLDELASDLGFFKIGSKGSHGIASQKKICFGVLSKGFGKRLTFQLFDLVKNSASNSPNASVECSTISLFVRSKAL